MGYLFWANLFGFGGLIYFRGGVYSSGGGVVYLFWGGRSICGVVIYLGRGWFLSGALWGFFFEALLIWRGPDDF